MKLLCRYIRGWSVGHISCSLGRYCIVLRSNALLNICDNKIMTRPTKQKAHSTITLVVRCTRMVMAIGKSVLFETCSNSHISLLQVNMQGKYISDKTRVFIWGEFKLFIAWVLCLKCLLLWVDRNANNNQIAFWIWDEKRRKCWFWHF